MNTLVVGGTGMLAGVLKGLLDAGEQVYSVSRHAPKQRHERLHPLLLDYHDLDALQAALQAHAPFDRAVVWIHSSAPAAPLVVAEAVQGDYFHVLGSAAADPARPDPARRSRFEGLGVHYQEIILGFQPVQGGSRWLSHAEISAGVWQALQNPSPRSVVGTVEPWEARP